MTRKRQKTRTRQWRRRHADKLLVRQWERRCSWVQVGDVERQVAVAWDREARKPYAFFTGPTRTPEGFYGLGIVDMLKKDTP